MAAVAGAHVVATDWSPGALRLADFNAQRNGTLIETTLCDWSAPDELVARGPWDLVLGSEVIYEPASVFLMLALLPRLVDASGAVLISCETRPGVTDFMAAAASEWRIEAWNAPSAPDVILHRLRLRL